MGAFNEGKLGKPCALSDREYILEKKKYEINSNNYINAGLLVVSRPQKYLFHLDNIKKHNCLLESPFVEQTYINYMIQLHDTPMTLLPESFNRMRVSYDEEKHMDIDPEYVLHSGNHIYHITSWHGSQGRRLMHVRDIIDILKESLIRS